MTDSADTDPDATARTTARARRAPVVELIDVARTYPSDPPVEALKSAHLTITSGDYVAIMGRSGSGKSTLLNVLGLLDAPTTGEYFLDGEPTATLSEAQRCGIRAFKIGFVFQSFHLIPYRSAVENVELGLLYQRTGARDRRERAFLALQQVGLAHRMWAPATQMSGGERQRVAIARALIRSPSLILCDEPTGNLDTTTSQELLALLSDLNSAGMTVITITHDLEVSSRAGRIVRISDGRLTENETAARHRPLGAIPADEGTTSTARPKVRRSDRLRARVRAVDLLSEAVAGVTSRPLRSLLTALGTVVGVGAFVATTGLASTASAQIGERFDALKATEVRIEDARPDGTNPFPDDVDHNLDALNGVNAAGVYWNVAVENLDPRLLPTRLGRPSSGAQIPVVAASPGAIEAALPVLQSGRLYDQFLAGRAERVAVIGRAAAQQLGLTRVDDQPAVFIGEIGYTVIGIIDDVARNPDLLLSVAIPTTTAVQDLPTGSNTYQVLIDVAPGAAQLIGRQAPLSLRPDQPERLLALVPPDPNALRQDVETDVTGLFYALAGLALFVGMIGIANTTLVAIIERQHEIAVRRALGARRRHIAAQVLSESALLGTLGGITGTAIALIAITIVSASRQWTTTIEPWIPLAAPLAGAVTGLLAGLQPARRSTRGQIADVLR